MKTVRFIDGIMSGQTREVDDYHFGFIKDIREGCVWHRWWYWYCNNLALLQWQGTLDEWESEGMNDIAKQKVRPYLEAKIVDVNYYGEPV